MMSDWNDANWWWWLDMLGGMLLFWAFAALVVVQAIRSTRRGDTHSDPEATLADRFARGEIDADAYQARLDVLRGRRDA